MNLMKYAQNLIEQTALFAGIKKERLLEHNRSPMLLRFRDIAIHLVRNNTELSTPEIGALFGARHHTTILSALNRAKIRLERNAPFRNGTRERDAHEAIMKMAQAANDAEIVLAPVTAIEMVTETLEAVEMPEAELE